MTNDSASSDLDNTSSTSDQPNENSETENTETVNEPPSTENEQAVSETTEDNPGFPLKKVVIAIIIIALPGLIAFGLWKSYQPKTVELQGRVEAETVHVSTKIPGRIEELYVHDGQKVTKNRPLVRLFSPEVDAKKQQALAALQSALALQSTAERGSQQENIDTLYAKRQSMKAQEHRLSQPSGVEKNCLRKVSFHGNVKMKCRQLLSLQLS